LNILPTDSSSADANILQVECAWDSSLHNSIHLNRVTSSDKNDIVIVTLCVHIEIDACRRPVLVSKDLYLKIQGRDAQLSPSKSFLSLFQNNKNSRSRPTKTTGLFYFIYLFFPQNIIF